MQYFRKRVRKYWSQSAKEKEVMARQALALYQERLNLKSANILEVGCGGGDFSMELAKAGAEVVALDISKKRIELLQQRASGKDVNLNLVIGDAQQTSFHSETFDFILCRNVIEHVSNPPKLVEEMARLSKPGGAMQLTAPNRYSISQLFRDEHYPLPFVSILPRKLAAFLVCRIFTLEDKYSVSNIPSYPLLNKWIKLNGLVEKMDLPKRNLIREKWCNPSTVNSRLTRKIVVVTKALCLNQLIVDIVSAETFLGLFAARWSLWITKPVI